MLPITQKRIQMAKVNGNKKIFCVGSNLESFNSLKYLIDKGCKIGSLITLPRGFSKGVSDYVDMHDLCTAHNIEVIDTTNINDWETVQSIRKRSPDFLFTLGWSQIFKKELIDSFSCGIIGTHPSALPYGRGRAPVPWTILEGIKKTAVSFFKIDLGIDTGKIIAQREIVLSERPYAMDLYNRVAEELGKGFFEIYSKVQANEELSLEEQSIESLLHRGKRISDDGLIDFNQSIVEVDRLVRAVSVPFPGAYCYYKDKKINFWEVFLDSDQSYKGTIGQILKKDGACILVQVADGAIWLAKPTNESGEEITSNFFKVGEKMGYNVQDQIHFLRNKL